MPDSFIFDVNETDFSEKVLKASHQQPVLVDFWADWCPPCRFLTPVLEKVTQDCRGEVLLAKVEADDNSARSGIGRATGMWRVTICVSPDATSCVAFPPSSCSSGGEEAGRFSGARSEPQVRTFISGLVPVLASRDAGA